MLFKDLLVRIKKSFTPEIEKSEEENLLKSLSWYREEKIIIKSLFDTDMIDLDEYVEKLNILDNQIKQAVKKVARNNYADAIIRNVKGDILFLRRNSNDVMFPGDWGLPGGKIDIGETPEEAVKREVFEETGMTVLECYPLGKKKLEKGNYIYYFNCIVKDIDTDIILDNDEHYSFEYIDKYNYNKYKFILDLKDFLLRMEFPERYQKIEEIKKSIDGLEPVSFDKEKKYTAIRQLANNEMITDDIFLHHLEAVSKLSLPEPDIVLNSKFELKNQTKKPDNKEEDDIEVLKKAEEEKSKLERAKESDLITLPKDISGTNCGNCKYIDYENHICQNPKVAQKVSNRMCCYWWDAEGVIRNWEQKEKK